MAIAQYSSQKKYPPPKGEEIFWCSSGDFPYRG